MNPTIANNLIELKDQLSVFSGNDSVKSILLLGADEGHPSKDEMDPILHMLTKPIIGGIFPGLVANSERMSKGFLVIPLPFSITTAVVSLDQNPNDCLNMLEKQFNLHDIEKASSLFVFTDAFASNKSSFVENLFNYFGNTLKYLGGGAGSLSFNPFPCVIHNSGMHQNAAVLGLFEHQVSLGVAHGWTPIGKPLKVTRADGNNIISLDWRPAFETYKTMVEAHSDQTISEENFFEIAKSYPLGLVKLDSEMVIRDPYHSENGILHIVDEVPEGEYVSIMNGNMDSLLAGADTAYLEAKERAGESTEQFMFCIDCISRVLYMQDEFYKEIETISRDKKAYGVLSIGEIANKGETFLEIYNKTIVIALWPTKT